MKLNFIISLFFFVIVLMCTSAAFADWSVKKHPMGPGFIVVHDSGDPGKVINKTYKTERGARKAAKALNKAEDIAEK